VGLPYQWESQQYSSFQSKLDLCVREEIIVVLAVHIVEIVALTHTVQELISGVKVCRELRLADVRL
jgi:hypothetical protein